jgi:protein phosphatase PTC7
MLPHIKKRATGGEDAYFTTIDKSVIGLADGVGGWNKKGVNPALFSRELCSNFNDKYENLRHLKNNLVV